MKLGTLKSSHRDGSLVVVSQDNTVYAQAHSIASHLREALEHWTEIKDKLFKLYQQVNERKVKNHPVKEEEFHSPLPRSFQWIDGSAYIQHIKLVRQARKAPLPETLETIPLVYQGGSDTFLTPTEKIPQIDFEHGTDFEAEVGVIVDDVPMGISPQEALSYIRLVVLINDVSLRNLIPEELKRGFGFLQSKPSSSFAPFALTLDELGNAWKSGRIHLPLHVKYNNHFFGKANAKEMHFSFGQIISHIAYTRKLSAGTIIGSGTVSNEDTSQGSSCLAEKRMLEKIKTGHIITPFMKKGDRVRIFMLDEKGNNLFGNIDQTVT